MRSAVSLTSVAVAAEGVKREGGAWCEFRGLAGNGPELRRWKFRAR